MPQTTSTPLAILGLTTGEAPLLVGEAVPQASEAPKAQQADRTSADEQSSGGVIFTEHTMPSLEELLEQNRIATATLLPGAAAAAPPGMNGRRSVEAVVLASTSGAISMAGWVLLVADVVSGSLKVNPYIALGLALGGLVLVATVAVAVKTSTRP